MSLVALQSRLKVLVAAEPLLDGRPVLIEEKGNLVNDVETALAETALAVVIAPARGQAAAEQAKTAINSDETFEVVIHRGALADAESPSTVAVLDALRLRLHGALVAADAPTSGRRFRYLGHELRELGDGAYARALNLGVADAG